MGLLFFCSARERCFSPKNLGVVHVCPLDLGDVQRPDPGPGRSAGATQRT